MKKTKHFISVLVFSVFIFLAFGSVDDDKKNNSDTSIISGEISGVEMSPEKTEVRKKLKDQAERDWPNNHTTQEYWVKEQLEAYDYMLTVPSDAFKQKAQKDWPLDYVTQKYWYDQQKKD